MFLQNIPYLRSHYSQVFWKWHKSLYNPVQLEDSFKQYERLYKCEPQIRIHFLISFQSFQPFSKSIIFQNQKKTDERKPTKCNVLS